MSNSLSVLDMIAARAMKVAHEKATFIGTIDRQFDDSYNATTNGSKNGQTLRVRQPNMYTRRQGSRVMDVQDTTELTKTITVATQDGVDLRFNSAELSQSIDHLDEQYITPAISSLVSGIDADMITQFTKSIANTVGTAGTVVGSSSGDITALFNARAKLNQYLAPKDSNRALQIDSLTMAAIVNGNKAIFQPAADVKEAFREGFYARSAMADFYENERTWTMTNSDDVTGNTDAAALVTDGGETIDMHTDIPVAKQTVGEVFTVAGVYACHPETKQAYSHLQQFVITAIGATTTTISPKTYLTGARQNVCSAAGAQLATTAFNAAAVTPWGLASAVLRQNIMYHKNAFAFVTAELPMMADAALCKRVTKDGLSLRVWQGSDIRNDELLIRVDILYGGMTLRPEWGCRVSN
jgi:hypothetical protein